MRTLCFSLTVILSFLLFFGYSVTAEYAADNVTRLWTRIIEPEEIERELYRSEDPFLELELTIAACRGFSSVSRPLLEHPKKEEIPEATKKAFVGEASWEEVRDEVETVEANFKSHMIVLHNMYFIDEDELQRRFPNASPDTFSKWKKREYLKYSFMDYTRAFSGAEKLSNAQIDEMRENSLGKLFKWTCYVDDISHEKGFYWGRFAIIELVSSKYVSRAFVLFPEEQKGKLLKYRKGDKITFEGRFVDYILGIHTYQMEKISAELVDFKNEKLEVCSPSLVQELGEILTEIFAGILADPTLVGAVEFVFVNGRIVEDERPTQEIDSLPEIKLATPKGRDMSKKLEAEIQVSIPSLNPNKFYAPQNSRIFHRPSCRLLDKKGALIDFSSFDKAIDAGGKPCSLCNP